MKCSISAAGNKVRQRKLHTDHPHEIFNPYFIREVGCSWLFIFSLYFSHAYIWELSTIEGSERERGKGCGMVLPIDPK